MMRITLRKEKERWICQRRGESVEFVVCSARRFQKKIRLLRRTMWQRSALQKLQLRISRQFRSEAFPCDELGIWDKVHTYILLYIYICTQINDACSRTCMTSYMCLLVCTYIFELIKLLR